MRTAIALILFGLMVVPCKAQEQRPVDIDNYARAETSFVFDALASRGAFGKFLHGRRPLPLVGDEHKRINRDTLVSSAVFDLDAAPVTIGLPNTGRRLMSAQVIDEQHYTDIVAYSPATLVVSKETVGSRYAAVILRIVVDPFDEGDIASVNRIQDGILVSQAERGIAPTDNWSANDRAVVRDGLQTLFASLRNRDRMFGAKRDVDPLRHLIGTAVRWGDLPSSAFQEVVGRTTTEGKIVETLTLTNIPAESWTLSVYDRTGFVHGQSSVPNSLNSLKAEQDDNSSVTIQFGGCSASNKTNCLFAPPDWTYVLRLYRLNTSARLGWSAPALVPAYTGNTGE